MSIDDLIIVDTIHIDHIRYECKKYNYFSKIVYPYNCKSNIPQHKFWVHIDKCKLTNNNITGSTNDITVALSLRAECMKHIKMIEKQINLKLTEDELYNVEIDTQLVNDNKSVPLLNLTVDKNTMVFDSDDTKINFHQIQMGHELSLICELHYLILSDSALSPCWRVVQAKRIESFDISKPLFSLLAEKKQIVEKVPIVVAQQPKIMSDIIVKHQPTNNNDLPKKSSFIPSVADLSNAILGLKKTTDTKSPVNTPTEKPLVEEKITTVEAPSPPIMKPKLRHVITKEPLSVAELLKQQVDFEKSLIPITKPLKKKELINEYKRMKRVRKSLKEWKLYREEKYNEVMKMLEK